jgi:aspartate/methionine/tyrosine aminotransferase
VRLTCQILCNPQNPLGRTYPRDTLLAYARFCEERDLHLVSDEIYAMSVYENKCERSSDRAVSQSHIRSASTGMLAPACVAR